MVKVKSAIDDFRHDTIEVPAEQLDEFEDILFYNGWQCDILRMVGSDNYLISYDGNLWSNMTPPNEVRIPFEDFKVAIRKVTLKDFRDYIIVVPEEELNEFTELLKKSLESYSIDILTSGSNYYFSYQNHRWGNNIPVGGNSLTFSELKAKIKGESMTNDYRQEIVKLSDAEEFRRLMLAAGEAVYNGDLTNYASSKFLDGRWHFFHDIDDTTITQEDFFRKYHKLQVAVESKTTVSEPKTPKWKNPKPKVKNQRDIEIGQYVLVEGQALGLKLERVESDGSLRLVYDQSFDIYTSSVSVDRENVYPLFKKLGKPSIGDVIKFEEGPWDIITAKNGDTFKTSNSKGEFIELLENDVVYSTKPGHESATEYTCGKIEMSGKVYESREELNKTFNGKLKVTNIEHPYEFSKICKHYNVLPDALKPKDVEIHEAIMTALEHPLNIKAKEWCYLYGKSGGGKSTAALRYAEAVGRDYIMLQGHQQMSVDDLLGYVSIVDGKYFPSLLRDAVENGKVCIIDEIDAISPAVLIALNGLKHEYFQFPDARVKIHKDFRIIATANTYGEYSEEFNARAPLDKATLARFTAIECNLEEHHLAIRYSLKYVSKITVGNKHPRDVEREVRRMMIDEAS